jgi:predicted membrane-bound spermidine synthase
MLFLDGVLQSASSDEAIYHRALINPFRTTEYENALILGGAEGAAAREVFASQPGVKKVVMVDWDSELVDWMRKEGEAAFADPRLSIVSEDVDVFLSAELTLFDTVFVDLLDPDEESWPWLASVLEKSLARLSPKGFLTVNLGSNKKVASTLISYLRKKWMWFTEPYCIFVPSFQEPWYMACVSGEPRVLNLKHGAELE